MKLDISCLDVVSAQDISSCLFRAEDRNPLGMTYWGPKIQAPTPFPVGFHQNGNDHPPL